MEQALSGLYIKLRPFMARVDRFTDKITSYRLVLYFLCVLTAWATALSLFGYGPFKWYEILLSAGWLVIVCRVTNLLLARQFNVASNYESDFITALILALIMSPPVALKSWIYITLAAIIAIASKYLINIGRKHIFNPAAVGAASAALLFNFQPSWWIGMEAVAPLLLIGGFLVARKINRLDMVGLFLVVYMVLTFAQLILDMSLGATLSSLWSGLTASSLLFFAGIMLTEPLTSPRQRNLYLLFGGLVGVLYSATGLEIRPEQALLIGNLAGFIADPNPRRVFRFSGSQNEAEGIETYQFEGKKGLKFDAGQYMEWTLPGRNSDSRGNRRYMTISSSPTEPKVTFTVKVPEQPSSFKMGLQKMHPGDSMLAGQLSGRFILPPSEKAKLAWLAGGIGVTPFRSMAKAMTDFEQQRDITLIYFANNPSEFAFKDVFLQAEKHGLKTVYSVTGEDVPARWRGENGSINKKMLEHIIPDFTERQYYISGPHGFVTRAEQVLHAAGISPKHIITDYFPGYS